MAATQPSPEKEADDSVFNVVELGSAGGSFVQRLRKSTTLLAAPVTQQVCTHHVVVSSCECAGRSLTCAP